MTAKIDSTYANTDLDLRSKSPFQALIRELEKTCCVLHYTDGEDGNWYSIVESNHSDESHLRNAAVDIMSMLDAINGLSAEAKAEFDLCELREFNVGFHCGDTWAFVHTIPTSVVRAVADSGCSIAVTLYPMRNPDGSPKDF